MLNKDLDKSIMGHPIIDVKIEAKTKGLSPLGVEKC
jgi:hypothetical protein